MDKRTLLFVFSLTIALFFVNTYFERGRSDELKDWSEQQRSKKEKEIVHLEREISGRTVKAQELPITQIYGAPNNQNPLIKGIVSDGSIVTLPWTKQIPEKVYANGNEYTLTFSEEDGPIVYQIDPKGTVLIGNLPYFGKFPLQMISFDPQVSVFLGNYTDGQFSIPAKKLVRLKKELEIEGKEPTLETSLVLSQSGDKFLPVAVYLRETDSLVYLEQLSALNTQVVAEKIEKGIEKYFVLENEFQQLVFSNIGGALIEANLPFQTEQNENSVVQEIGFDRDIVKNHPYNAHFPAHPYKTPDGVEHAKGKLGGYYPLLRRDLIQSGKRKSIRILPELYSLNIVSLKYPELGELTYDVTHFDDKSITFEAKQRNRKITKTFTIDSKYIIHLTVKVDGDSRGLWLSTGVPEVEWISNGPAPALKYRQTRKGKSEVSSLSLPDKPTTNNNADPDWICTSNGFFGMILDPLTEIDTGFHTQRIAGTVSPSRLIQIDEEYDRFKPKDLPGFMMMLPLNAEGGTMEFRIFAGPFDTPILRAVDAMFTDPETGANPDYIASRSFHGWFSFISAPISKFLMILMRFFHTITGSWAFSIILLTAALRVMLFPLNAWSTKSMLKMQQIAPEVTRIQEKYKKDPKKSQLEIMNLYRDRGVNPVSGCFPMLIQMPFLIGMFDLLKSAFELRGASFIPGWIDNLAAPDVLFSWEKPLMFIGNEFHLLPFLLGGVMFLQQRFMSTAPKDPNLMTDQQRQQRTMGNIMGVFFTFLFYNFPAGLNIYWLSSMLLGVLQQWWTQKRFNAQPVKAELQVAPTKPTKNKRRR